MKKRHKNQVTCGSLTLPAPAGEAYNRDRICIQGKSHNKELIRRKMK